jgi:hypothetical protein
VFFLLGAMTIVEIVDSHQGFKLVTDNISTRNPKTLLWVVSLSYFYVSLTEVFITFYTSYTFSNLQCATMRNQHTGMSCQW